MAAVIASLFGVKGTIVGVAIGSAAATFGTTLLAHSIERGHAAVKQVVVRVPARANLLRLLGGTAATGVTESVPIDAGAPAEEGATTSGQLDDTVETTSIAATAVQEKEELTPPNEPVEPSPSRRGFRWPAIAGTAAIVFVLSLMFVTAVELVAGKPLTNLLGGHSGSNAPSVGQIFGPAPAPTTTTPPSTTSSTTTSTSTTTTTPTSTTTSTSGASGTTTSGPSGTTTTGGTGSTTTSTTLVATTTTKPG